MSEPEKTEKSEVEVDSEDSELKSELTQFQEEIESSSPTEKDEDLSVEVMDLKRRITVMEKDIKGLSEALKATLTDIRGLIAELDNPFNILRSVGVDNLVQRVMEQMEDEVSKTKREEMKKKIAKDGDGEQKEKIIVASSPAIFSPSNNDRATNNQVNSFRNDNASNNTGSNIKHYTSINNDSFNHKTQQNLPTNSIQHLYPPASFLTYPVSSKTSLAKKIDNFSGCFSEGLSVTYRTAYLMLVAEYLLLRVGGRKADLLLTDYAKRGWVSPTIIRDLLDILNLLKPYNLELNLQGNTNLEDEIDVEDHLLIINFLKKIEELSIKDEDPVNVLFMLFLSKSISYILKVFYLLRKNLNSSQHSREVV